MKAEDFFKKEYGHTYNTPFDSIEMIKFATRYAQSQAEQSGVSDDKLLCKDCGGELDILRTFEGDPEGIRHDKKCLSCGVVWGFTKAMPHKLSPVPVTVDKDSAEERYEMARVYYNTELGVTGLDGYSPEREIANMGFEIAAGLTEPPKDK